MGLYRWARDKVEREENHLQVTLKQSRSKEWEKIEASKASAWVRRVEWRVCMGNGTENQRRGPTSKRGEREARTRKCPEGEGEGIWRPESARQRPNRNGKIYKGRENINKHDRERTVDQQRVDNDSERNLRTTS